MPAGTSDKRKTSERILLLLHAAKAQPRGDHNTYATCAYSASRMSEFWLRSSEMRANEHFHAGLQFNLNWLTKVWWHTCATGGSSASLCTSTMPNNKSGMHCATLRAAHTSYAHASAG
eukprot:2230382-Amphidinium_carterae.1